MSTKSMFRLAAQSPKYTPGRDSFLNRSIPPRHPMAHDDSVFMGVDNASIRNSPQLLWQTLTPELRAEALRRAHLIQLLRQVNPNLQLCRKGSSQTQPITAEKGIQVPDIRYEFANNRKFPARSTDIKRSASFTAPGVRIQPRTEPQAHHSTENTGNLIQPKPNALKPSATSATARQGQNQKNVTSKETTLQVTLINVPCHNTDRKTESTKEETTLNADRATDETKEDENKESVLVVDDEGKSSQKTERQVVVKSKEASSGDEDSVVVVLNQPRTEQGLERKYGQFFCRRCLRGWSSRGVWCVRHTCKVYIKQTCNMCNKLVNPYLVCNLPPINSSKRSGRK